MKSPRLSLRLAIAVIVAAIGLPCVARSAPAANEVTVPEDALNSLIGQPQADFHQAFALFTQGDFDGAAAQMRSSAALLRLEAGRGDASSRARLTAAADQLDAVAAKVEQGNVGSRTELNQVFARADLALAAHYRAMAAQSVNDKQHAAAGRWLHAAADSVDDATHWTGQQPTTAQAQAWDQVHALNAKIHTGANWTYDEAKVGIGYLGTQIQYLGSRMQQFASPTPTAP
jgi:hypothetical protein